MRPKNVPTRPNFRCGQVPTLRKVAGTLHSSHTQWYMIFCRFFFFSNHHRDPSWQRALVTDQTREALTVSHSDSLQKEAQKSVQCAGVAALGYRYRVQTGIGVAEPIKKNRCKYVMLGVDNLPPYTHKVHIYGTSTAFEGFHATRRRVSRRSGLASHTIYISQLPLKLIASVNLVSMITPLPFYSYEDLLRVHYEYSPLPSFSHRLLLTKPRYRPLWSNSPFSPHTAY